MMIGAKETDVQAAVVAWATLMESRWPDLEVLYAIPNAGGYTGTFKQNMLRVLKMKREGVKSGVPDLHLPVARGGHLSLYLELKREVVKAEKRGVAVTRTRTTREQDDWHARLRKQGHHVVVCWTAEEAQEELERYLEMQPTRVVQDSFSCEGCGVDIRHCNGYVVRQGGKTLCGTCNRIRP